MITEFFRHLLGSDRVDDKAHDIKNEIQHDSAAAQIHFRNARKQIEESTAYKIAKAAGRLS